MPRAASSGTPLASKRAQIGDRAGEREGQFLRFRAAGIVDDAAVGDRERAAEALLGEVAHHVGEELRDSSRPGQRADADARP